MSADIHLTTGRGSAKLLVSACLLGNPVRYDGKANTLQHSGLQQLLLEDRLVPLCPEVAGGLPIPRAAAEIEFGDGSQVLAGRAAVKSESGEDLSACFLSGAEKALAICRQYRIDTALLTERSPSCGSSEIYDGSFTRRKIAGTGVTTALLIANGIRVFSQYQVEAAIRHLNSVK